MTDQQSDANIVDLTENHFGPCCFCGQWIEKNHVDPCSLSVETSFGKWQVWFCHAECFKNRIATNTEINLSPAHF